jgi:multidrug transporter EmrE-like cation transporter
MSDGIILKITFFILIIMAAMLEASGDIILKKWAIDQKQFLFMIGIGVYFIATVVWAFSLRYEFLSKAISIITILNLVIVVLVGVLYFKEDLSMINKVGIVLGIISVILIQH